MVSINITLVFTIINLVIFYLLMKKFLIGPINAVMEKRESMIKDQLLNAQTVENEAQRLKAEYEESLKGARTQSAEIVEDAKARAQKEYERIVAEASVKTGKMLDDSRKTIERERDQALQDMQAQIAQLAMAAVGKVLPGQLSDEENNMYYARFLEEAGEGSEAGSR